MSIPKHWSCGQTAKQWSETHYKATWSREELRVKFSSVLLLQVFFFYPFHLVLTLLFCTVLLKKYQFSCFNSKQAFSLYKTSRKLKMICFGNFFPGTKSSWYQMNEVILILMKFLSMAEIRTTTMHHVKRSLQGVGVGISFSVTVWLDSW